MKINKNIFYILLILFELAFFVKIILSFLRLSPFILPDEICVLVMARHFAENLNLASCSEITTYPLASPMFLFSILISPIYFFTYGIKAYSLTLTLNSFLVSSLVFPLYGIFSRFISNKKAIFILLPFFIFLPAVTVYEQTVMTEILFLVLNIWFLYFYMNSFDNRKNKITAFILAFLAIFARPFGFITITAALFNEILMIKRKKIVFMLIPFVLLIPTAFVVVFYPDLLEAVKVKFLTLSNPFALKWLGLSLTGQINSLTLAGLFVPCIIFFMYVFQKDSRDLNRIRYFLLSFIFINLAISMQHIYGYFTQAQDPVLITRYINVSIVFINIFAAIFFMKYKKIIFNFRQIILFSLVLFPFLFFKFDGIKHTLNMDLSVFYNTGNHLYELDLVTPKPYVLSSVLILSFFSLILFLTRRRKIFSSLFLGIFALYSVATIGWAANMPDTPDLVIFFEKSEKTITFMLSEHDRQNHVSMLIELNALTKNLIHVSFIKNSNTEDILSRDYLFENSEFAKESDYILSDLKIDLPLVFTSNSGINVYLNDNKQYEQQD